MVTQGGRAGTMSHWTPMGLAVNAIELGGGLVFHDDLGVKYTSGAFRRCPRRPGST